MKSPYSLLVLFKFSIFSCLGLGRILILGIYPFLSGYPICWPIIFHNSLYGLLYFCSVSCNISSFIYNFIYLNLLSFFLCLAKVWSIFFIFSEYQFILLLIFSVVFLVSIAILLKTCCLFPFTDFGLSSFSFF